MKRLVLVPEEVYASLCTTRAPTNPYVKQLEEKSQKMSASLEDPLLSDDAKIHTYEHQLKCMKMLKNAHFDAEAESPRIVEVPEHIPVVVQDPPLPAIAEPPVPPRPACNQPLRTAREPTTMEHRVARLTQQLLRHRQRLPLTERGSILDAQGRVIVGSRIDRILQRMLSGQLGGRKPNGFAQFQAALHRSPDLHSLIPAAPKVQTGTGQAPRFVPTKWTRS